MMYLLTEQEHGQIVDALNVAFDFDGDVFGVHHNAAVDVLAMLKAKKPVEPVGTVVDPTYAAMSQQLPYGTSLYTKEQR